MKQPALVHSSVVGDNSDLFAEVVKLYPVKGRDVIDATFGRGVFWRQIDTSKCRSFVGHDIAQDGVDCRKLPERDASADVVVIDPPYRPDIGASGYQERQYRGRETTRGMTIEAIIELYCEAMAEARRVLRPGGLCLVKCQDLVHGGKQYWSHIRIFEFIENEGYFTAEDLFLLHQERPPAPVPVKTKDGRIPKQKHARRRHSYLWIFRKGRGNPASCPRNGRGVES